MNKQLSRPLILASASPRRAELLQQLDIPFAVQVGHASEPSPLPGEDLLQWAQNAALLKARATAAIMPASQSLILAADTVVVCTTGHDDELPILHGQSARVLGKPRDSQDAWAMLQLLSGSEHTVISAFALLSHPEGKAETEVVETLVRFRKLTDVEIEEYIAGGEPMDKAGAYGIQGRGAIFIEGITGDYYTVVGLPLSRLWQRLSQWHVNF